MNLLLSIVRSLLGPTGRIGPIAGRQRQGPFPGGSAAMVAVFVLFITAAFRPTVAQPASPVPAATPATQPSPEIPSWLSGAIRAGGVTPESRPDCVLCHLDWAEAFKQPSAILLIDKPTEPVVTQSDTCLGCHDGGVGDARKRVWVEHGHKTGVVPPPGIVVPDVLPLQDGKIACRTCHSAHGGLGPQTISTIVFLRVQNDRSQLCMLCHNQMAKGPSAGMHYIGQMDKPVPEQILAAGGKSGPPEFNVICQSCHTAHGASEQHLEVLPAATSALCAPCHPDKTPGAFRSVAAPHPQNPPLKTAAQHKAIKEMGTIIGPDDRLVCMSCHKPHNAQPDSYILAAPLAGSQLCIRCHPDMQDVISNSPHDLQKTAPDSHNLRDQTPATSGPCGACHGFHSFARTPEPRPGDPTGLCTTCHQPGGVAAEHTGLPLSHPANVTAADIPGQPTLPLYTPYGQTQPRMLACLTCHQPHRVGAGNFLRDRKDVLCAGCHVDQATNLPAAHSFANEPALKNGRNQSAEESGRCGFCHAVHNAIGPMMWVAQKDAPATPDQLCTLCHREGGLENAKPPARYTHPTGPAAAAREALVDTKLPLFDLKGHVDKIGFVACGSCHDPHVNTEKSAAMLREAASSPADLCIQCHRSQADVAAGPHDTATHPDQWPADLRDSKLCMACHKAHSDDPVKQLWTIAPASKAPERADGICMTCHTQIDWAASAGQPALGQVVHARVLAGLAEVPDLPMAPASQPGTTAALECRTCHNPHSHRADWHMLRQVQIPGQPQTQGPATVCYSCHPVARPLDDSLHAPWVSPALQSSSQACGPCHAVHAVKGSLRYNLWAAGLNPIGADPAAQECLACHTTAGPGKAVHVVVHPDVLMSWMTGLEIVAGQPLRQITSQGRISCITCHLPHGRFTSLMTGGLSGPPPRPSLAALQAAKPMLRPNVARELCSTCHGFTAARLYLYFHKPAMRPAAFPALRPQEPAAPGP